MDMADKRLNEPLKIDYSLLITAEHRPVDNCYSDKQRHILPDILESSWPEGKPFIALTDVGLFSNLNNADTMSPDFMLSLGVEQLPFTNEPESRSYFMWVYGKAPDLVIELVSNRVGGELGARMERYRKIGVSYYAVFDPLAFLSKIQLRLFCLTGGQYVEMTPTSLMPQIGLGLTVWDGVYRGVRFRWLRFVDQDGRMLNTAQENTEAESARAEAERAKAEAESSRAEAERAKAEAESARAEAEKARADAAVEAGEAAKSGVIGLILSTLQARFESVPEGVAQRLSDRELTELFPLAQRAATAKSLDDFLTD